MASATCILVVLCPGGVMLTEKITHFNWIESCSHCGICRTMTMVSKSAQMEMTNQWQVFVKLSTEDFLCLLPSTVCVNMHTSQSVNQWCWSSWSEQSCKAVLCKNRHQFVNIIWVYITRMYMYLLVFQNYFTCLLIFLTNLIA